MHRLLEQQTQRFLRKDVPLPPGWDMFLAAVDDAYSSAAADRQRLEHSLELMSKELSGLRADLAERQLAEAQLEHLLSLLGATLESTADGIMALGKDGRLVRFNQRFIEMWRIPDDITAFWEHDRMMECICTQLKQTDDGFIAKVNYLNLHLQEESFNLLECLDGRLIECYSLSHTLGLDTVGRVFSFRDITERKRAEESLKNMASKLHTVFESSSDAIMLLDEKGFFDCNPSTLRMFGCPSHEAFISKHPAQLSPPTQPSGEDSMSLANEHIVTAFKSGSNRFEWLHRRFDGSNFPAEVLLTAMELDNKTVLQATVRDITERKRAEDALHREKEEQNALIRKLETAHNQLLQSEKMASIGQLAAGVAHEINNPIGYVNSNLGSLGQYVEKLIGIIEAYERVESDLSTPSLLEEIRSLKREADWEYLKQDVRDLLSESAEGTVRVIKIVQDLKDFSHVDQTEWLCVDLHKGIDSTLNITHSEIKCNAEVIKEYGTIPPVECMASQLNQVFMNMLINASHAIGDGNHGKITIRSGTENDMVWVEFADTGKGIAPENLKRIFDPFFTTKPVGVGTGLGLSLSFGIIKKHHGRIEVKSEAGNGATFRVWLPVKQSVGAS